MASTETNATFLGVPYNLVSTANLTAGSESSNFPGANLATFSPQEIWQTSGTTDAATIEVDLGSTDGGSVGGMYLVNHNLSTVGTIRVRGDNTTAFSSTELIDSGVSAAWTAGGLSTDIQGDFFWISTAGNASRQYWLIDIADTGGLSSSISAGHMGLGNALSFNFNANYGATLDYMDLSRASVTANGFSYIDSGPIQKKFNLQFSHLTNSTAFEDVVTNIFRRKGTNSSFFFCLQPDLSTERHNLSALVRAGRSNTLQSIVNKNFPWAFSVSLMEIVG